MLRITGGEFRGRMIKTPNTDKVRPTRARLRQALFNSIQTSIADARVLDLFAGSGSLGLEALSRGASHVTFVEDSRQAIRLVEENLALLKVRERTRVWGESVDRAVQKFANSGEESFDVVLADPPYEAGWDMKMLEEFPWERLLKPDGLLCLEWGLLKSNIETLPDDTRFLVKIREKNYGDSVLSTFQMKGPS